jgi:hypothetical protein
MPSTDRKLELKAKTSVAKTGSQPYVYAKGLTEIHQLTTGGTGKERQVCPRIHG